MEGNGNQPQPGLYMKMGNDRRILVPAQGRTGDVANEFQPWRVHLIAVMNRDGDHKKFTYYARSKDPGQAGSICAMMWLKWERGSWPDGEFPQLAKNGGVECIDEDNWATALKEARKYKLQVRYNGPPINPKIFTVVGHNDV